MSIYQKLISQLSLPLLKNLSDIEAVHLTPTNNTLLQVVETSLRCESIGLGFAAGYRSALQCLLPSLDPTRWAAMCVTEVAGNHPRNIQTTVTDAGVVRGEKSFVTLADRKPQLIVVAKIGEGDKTPLLKALSIDSLAADVKVELMPALPMVPDIAHGKVIFDFAQGQLLEGDGYGDYSKRFRTIEDIHVLASFVSVLTSISYRYKLSANIFEQAVVLLASILSTFESLQEESPVLHLHMAGLFDGFKSLCVLFEASLDQIPQEVSAAWLRDKKLFGVANKARQARRERAQKALL